MWFIFLPLKQLSCFGNNNNNISSSSIPNTLWCLFWLWVDKKSVHAKIKCSFFCSLSVYILCIQNSPATYEQYVFSEAENKAHRIYMFIIINHPHAAATAFCWIHFSTLWVLHTKKWTWHICLISTVAHLAFVNFFPHEIHSREWVKLIPRIIFVAVHWIESLSS